MSSMWRSPKHLWTLTCRSRLLSEHVRPIRKSIFALSCERHRPIFALQTSNLKTSCHLVNKAQREYNDLNTSPNHMSEDVLLRQMTTQLNKLDNDFLRKGRVSQLEIMKVFTLIKMLVNVTGPQGYLLIRCCGSHVPEMQKEKRTQLVQDIWKTLQDLKCPLDVSHYNALLKVYLENEHAFNPVEFLSNMEQQGVEPNRVTYHRFVSQYCQNGDIEGASKILEFMKAKEIPINEDTFNELITGHAHGNNMEDAIKIIDVMKNSQLAPNSSTYASLACGYARTGDIDKVLTTIEEASTQEINIGNKDILHIVYTLTINNHAHLVEKILPHLKNREKYSNDCLNVCLELINKGHHEIAYTLMNTMPNRNLPDGTLAPTGIFFIRQIIRENLTNDVIIDYCNRLTDAGLNDDAYIKAIEIAYQFSKPDLAFSLLTQMHTKGCELRPHYFWPILVSKKGSEEGLFDILKLMLDLKCPADSDTLTQYVMPYLSTKDPFTIITHLKDIGYELENVVGPTILWTLQNKDIKVAAEILEKYPIFVNPSVITVSLASAFISTEDVPSSVQILKYCKENRINSKETLRDVYDYFILKLVDSPNCSVPLLISLLTAMKEKEMKLLWTTATAVSQRLRAHDCTELTSILESLVSKPSSNQELDQAVNVTQTGAMSNRDRHLLLITYAKEKDVESTEKVMKELEESNFVYPDRTYNLLFDMYCHHGNLDKALYFKNVLESLNPEYRLYDQSVCNLASLMVCNKKFDDAANLINSHHSRFGRPQEPNAFSNSVYRLLNSYAVSEEPERINDAFLMLVDLGYCYPTKSSLRPLINAHLNKNDTVGAVNEFLRIVQTYKQIPHLYELLKHLVELEDSENLQKVIDAALKDHEDANVLLTLARVFIDCGQVKQARKVLETPGLRFNLDSVDDVCQKYLSRNMISELELFVQITKNVFGLNRERMYYHLLKGYVKTDNVEKALEIWVKLQEEDLLPSNGTMHLLGTFLERMKQPVPFTIPPDFEVDNYNNPPKSRQQENTGRFLNRRRRLVSSTDINTLVEISQLIQENKLDEALKMVDQVLDEGKHLTIDVVRQLAFCLSESGDTSSLLHLQGRVPPELAIKVSFNDLVPISSMKKGKEKIEEFLSSLETEVFKYKDEFPGGAFLKLLEIEPSTLDRVRKLVDVYYEKGNVLPRNMLWTYFMCQKMFRDADQIYEGTPEMHTNLRFHRILTSIRTNNDVELSTKFVDLASKSNYHVSEKGKIYSCHIDVLRSNKIDEALNFLRELQKTFSLKDLNRHVLLRLKRDLLKADMAVEFAVPLAVQQVQSQTSTSTSRRSSSTSSSESSDSD